MGRWLMLGVAILAEVIATTTLKSTEGFTRLWPSVVVVVCYETAFILLALVLKRMAMGVVYAVWSGAGVALVTLVGWWWQGQALSARELLGLALIVAGVAVINLFSSTVADESVTSRTA